MASMISEHESFQGVDGKPIVNGYIYVGVAGQDPKNNPVNIYADRELTTLIANPQRTDAYGRSVNKIWVADRYSLKIEDKDNAQKFQDLQRGELADSPTINLINVQGINDVTADAVPAVSSYIDKAVYVLTVVNDNTGAVTLDFGGGAKSVKKNNGDDLVAGDWPAGSIQRITYNAFSNRFDTLTFSTTEVNEKIAQAEQDIATLQIAPPKISGLVVTNNEVDPDHDIDISAGKFGSYSLASGITKKLDVTFGVGNGNGGMVGSLPSSGVVYVFLITNSVTLDVYAETTNGENPPVGWAIVKRIAARITDASNNLVPVLVSGSGDTLRISPVNYLRDFFVNTVPTTRTLYPISGVMSCPPNVIAEIAINMISLSSTELIVNSANESDQVPSINQHDLRTATNGTHVNIVKSFLVNEDRQIAMRRSNADITTSVFSHMISWIEDRG